MGHAIEFDDVRRAVARFGPLATLVSVTESPAPHVVTAVIEVGDGHLVARVGSRTRANVLDRPAVTLVWHPLDGGEYQLLLDGHATEVGEPDGRGVSTISVSIDRGILHRLAGLPAGPPTCLAVATA